MTGSQFNRDCNGVFHLEREERNGKYCFSRQKRTGGCIYFDGSFWKLCQNGKGPVTTGWNYRSLRFFSLKNRFFQIDFEPSLLNRNNFFSS